MSIRAAGERLADCGVFFGTWPEAIAFAAVLTLGNSSQIAHDAKEAVRRALGTFMTSADGVEVWPALGNACFDQGARPKRLTRLTFSGDGPDVTDFTDRILFGLFVGGAFTAVTSRIRRLTTLLRRVASVEIAFEIGMRYGQGHGHGGFLDGVSNLQELPPKYFDACVFVGAEDAPFAGGSYAVIRKYEENLEMWTDLPDIVQEQIIGRRKTDGRLIGGDLLWRRNGGEKVLATAHVACARPDRHNEGFSWQDRLYRRSINYMEAPDRGTISYGLVFLTLNRDPAIQTERIHNTYMFPQNSDGDLLMTAGYVRALRTFLVYLPPRRTLDT